MKLFRINLTITSGSHLIFISYNSADREIASNVALFLAAENLSTCYDEWKVSAGDSIIDYVQDGLSRCSHFIVIWSKNSDKSNWVRAELKAAISQALTNKKPTIIPIVLDETSLPPLLQDIHYLKYHGGTEQDRIELVDNILGKKPSLTFIRAIVRKYREVVFNEEDRGPFNYKVCPECGSDRLEGSSFTDYAHDDLYFTIVCKECGWGTWSQ